jgi:hypothetical protein
VKLRIPFLRKRRFWTLKIIVSPVDDSVHLTLPKTDVPADFDPRQMAIVHFPLHRFYGTGESIRHFPLPQQFVAGT